MKVRLTEISRIFKKVPRGFAMSANQQCSGMTHSNSLSNFLPLRWTHWQVGMFNYPRIMGYLHRPITVRLSDDESKPLAGEARESALREGWAREVGTLPVDDVPKRCSATRTTITALPRCSPAF
jgi:hypothetical protein